MSIKEKDFEKWLLNQLESKQISELIDNLNEMKDLSNAYLNNQFISNVKGALYQLSVTNWAKGVQLIDQLEFIKNQINIIKGRGRSSQIDLLFHIKGKGTFSIIEIKRPLKQNNKNKSKI